MNRLPMALALGLIVGACAESPASRDPVTSPLAPSPLAAEPDAETEHVLDLLPAPGLGGMTAIGRLSISCRFLSCSYKGQLRNDSGGCARNIKGTTSLVTATGRVLSKDTFSLPSSTTVRKGARITYSGCCLSYIAALLADYYTTRATFAKAPRC